MKRNIFSHHVFLYFISITFLVILLDYHRFSIFLDRESTESPPLAAINKLGKAITNNLGISWFTRHEKNIIQSLNQDTIIAKRDPDQRNFYSQLPYEFIQGIGEILGSFSASDPKSALVIAIPPVTRLQAPPAITLQAKPKIEKITPSHVAKPTVLKNINNTNIKSANNDSPKSVLPNIEEKKLTLPTLYTTDHPVPYNPTASKLASIIYGIHEYQTNIPDFGKKIRVLLIGDSMMMEGLGPALQQTLRNIPNVEVIRQGQYSSGLSRPDFFNWPKKLAELINKHDPHLTIISLGANDPQDIVVGTKRHHIPSKSWENIYEERAKELLSIATQNNRSVLWIGLPVMGKEPYFQRTKQISTLQKEATQAFPNAHFLATDHLLTKNGNYTTFIQDTSNRSIRLRKKDLIHLTKQGGEILANHILASIKTRIDAIYLQQVGGAIFVPVPNRANRVTFTSKYRQKQTEYYIYLPELPKNIYLPKSPTETPKKAEVNLISNTKKLIQTAINQNKTFPVIYLLHGATDSAHVWNDKMGRRLQKLATQNQVIIVAPTSEPFGWYVDSPIVPHNQIQSYLTKELVTHIDTLYPTNKKRALVGLSMGGHGAILTALNNPKLFAGAASISGILDIRLHPDKWNIKNILGDIDEFPENWDKNSVNGNLSTMPPNTMPKIQILTGKNDAVAMQSNRNAYQIIKSRNIRATYNEYPGKHNWTFWRQYIPYIINTQAVDLNSLP